MTNINQACRVLVVKEGHINRAASGKIWWSQIYGVPKFSPTGVKKDMVLVL